MRLFTALLSIIIKACIIAYDIMLLSIVIPSFNEENYLPILLESIKKQSFKDYEIIVADNLSSDKTKEIASQYGAIMVLGGLPGTGRNCGAAVAHGDNILFLDADVVLPIDFLQDILSEFKDKGYGVATCKVNPISDRKVDRFMHRCYNRFICVMADFLPFAPGFCILINHQSHDLIKGFDEAIMLGEDSEYVQRAGKIAKFGILKSQKIPVSVRRLDRDGRSNIAVKYILSGIYMCLIGNIKTNLFRYSFGHYKKRN
jgi:glycosyltransferase involved in cell wall biosynthesis